jgi:hypothetical protein
MKLSALHPQTGLVPLLLPAGADAAEEDFYFYEPAPGCLDQVGQMDAASVLSRLWDRKHEELRAPQAAEPEPPQPKAGLLGKLRKARHDGYSLADIAAAAAQSLAHHDHGGPGPAAPYAPCMPPPASAWW